MADYGKIVVFAGGVSSEREISLKSGHAVYESLKKSGLDVDFIDPKHELEKEARSVKAEVVFIALHGKSGEDGTLQRILEEEGVFYTGSGPEASFKALDKIVSREIFLNIGLTVPVYKIAKSPEELINIAGGFKLPFVVKPQYEGSSIGLSIVKDMAHAKSAFDLANKYGENVLVEEHIDGRELTVGIVEDEALPVVEIEARNNVYDFNAKYWDQATRYTCPASFDENVSKKAREYALLAHSSLGCRDFSRVDMIMNEEGKIFVLEVNTIPGMTERSLLPKAASARGLNFDNLCIKLIDLAYKRRGKNA